MWKSIFLLVNYTFQSLEYLTLIAQLQHSVVRYFSVTLYVTLDTNNWFPTSPWQLHVSFFWYDSLIKTQTNSSCLFIYFKKPCNKRDNIQSETLRLIQDPILAKPEKWQGQIRAGIMNRRSSFSSSIGVLCFSLSVCLSHFSTTAWSAMRRQYFSSTYCIWKICIVKIWRNCSICEVLSLMHFQILFIWGCTLYHFLHLHICEYNRLMTSKAPKRW